MGSSSQSRDAYLRGLGISTDRLPGPFDDEATVPLHEPDLVVAEKCVLAAALDDVGACRKVLDHLTPAHFSDRERRGLFAQMQALDDAGDPVDVTTLGSRGVDGEWLAELGEYVPGLRLESVDFHLRVLSDERTRREVADAGRVLSLLSGREDYTPEEVLQEAQRRLDQLRSARGRGPSFLTEREVDQLPEAEALVGDRFSLKLPAHSIGMIEGESGTWKTFLFAVDVGLAIQHGVESALGPTRQGQVVLVVGEGAHGIRARLAAWRSYHDVGYGGLLVMRESPRLRDQGSAARLLAALRALPEPPAYVLFDTFNTTKGSGSENKDEDVNPFLDVCREIAEMGACAAWVHHLNAEGEKHRGHTSLFTDSDFVLRMTKEEENRAQVACRKMKDAPQFDPVHVELVPHGDSLVVVRSKATARLSDSRDAPEYIRATLRQLDRSTAGDEGLATSKWETIAKEELEITHSTFYRHRTMLIEWGFVEPEEVAGGVRNRVTEKGREWLP